MSGTKDILTLYSLLRHGNEQPEVKEAILRTIKDDKEARKVYLQLVHMDINIPWVLESSLPVELAIQKKIQSQHSRGRLMRLVGGGSVVLTICLLITFGIRSHFTRVSKQYESPLVAATMDVAGDAVVADTPATGSKSLLKTNERFVLLSGAAFLRSTRGTLLVMTGPTVLEFHGRSLVKLTRGTVLVDVASGDHGFTVAAQSHRFIDRGTQFGVHVDQTGSSSMHVILGSVATVPRRNGPSQEILVSTTGQSVAFSSEGQSVPSEGTSNHFYDARILLDGISRINGPLHPIYPPPTSVRFGDLVDQHKISLITEQLNTAIKRPLTVIPPVPGRDSQLDGSLEAILPAETECCSYLVHCQQITPGDKLTATIEFEQPILGIIASTDGLAESDRIFGVAGILYPPSKPTQQSSMSEIRGSEIVPQKGAGPQDRIVLHSDGRSLTLTLESSSSGLDQLRIITGRNPHVR